MPAGWRHWRALAWLRGLFIPPARLRELHLIAHQRQKLVSQLARVVVKTIIAGQPPHEVLKFASRRLKASRVEIFDALQCDLTASHHFVLDELMPHIEEIEARIARFNARLLDELKDEHNTLALLQTLPGVDLMDAAMLLVEIGTDMNAFGRAGHMASKVGICPGTMSPPENMNLDVPARATLVFDGYFASSLMPPVVPDRCTNRSSSLSSFGAAINARSWLSATKYYALFSSCSNGTNITGIQH